MKRPLPLPVDTPGSRRLSASLYIAPSGGETFHEAPLGGVRPAGFGLELTRRKGWGYGVAFSSFWSMMYRTRKMTSTIPTAAAAASLTHSGTTAGGGS